LQTKERPKDIKKKLCATKVSKFSDM